MIPTIVIITSFFVILFMVEDTWEGALLSFPFQGISPFLSMSVIIVEVAVEYYNTAETGRALKVGPVNSLRGIPSEKRKMNRDFYVSAGIVTCQTWARLLAITHCSISIVSSSLQSNTLTAVLGRTNRWTAETKEVSQNYLSSWIQFYLGHYLK